MNQVLLRAFLSAAERITGRFVQYCGQECYEGAVRMQDLVWNESGGIVTFKYDKAPFEDLDFEISVGGNYMGVWVDVINSKTQKYILRGWNGTEKFSYKKLK